MTNDIQSVVDELVYRSYAYNRDLSPHHPPELYKKTGFAGDVDAMEIRYQRERRRE